MIDGEGMNKGAGALWVLPGVNLGVFVGAVVLGLAGIDAIEPLAYRHGSLNPVAIVSSLFVHASLAHVVVNLAVLALFSFGAVAVGLGRTLIPLYLVGGLAGVAGFELIGTEGEVLAGGSAGVLSVVAAVSVWLGDVRVRFPRLGCVRLARLGGVITLLSVAPCLFTGNHSILAVHLGGLLVGLLVAAACYGYGRRRVRTLLDSRRLEREKRADVAAKIRLSGYASLTDAEKRTL